GTRAGQARGFNRATGGDQCGVVGMARGDGVETHGSPAALGELADERYQLRSVHPADLLDTGRRRRWPGDVAGQGRDLQRVPDRVQALRIFRVLASLVRQAFGMKDESQIGHESALSERAAQKPPYDIRTGGMSKSDLTILLAGALDWASTRGSDLA